MKREELKAMGLTDEQVESVMAKNGAEVAALKYSDYNLTI